MKLTCPESGLSYSTLYGYGTSSKVHPALEVPLKRLVTQLSDFHSNKIESSQDQYLFLLAWFKNLPSVQFRTTAQIEQDFPALMLHSESLFRIVLTCAKFPHLPFPVLVVSNNSPISACLKHWLTAHDEILTEQKLKASKQRANAEILRLESTLERIASFSLRNNVTKASKLIGTWAAKAGDFSNEYVTSPTGESTTLSRYWQDIIVLAFKESHTEFLAAKIPPADIEELIEYCEDNIPHGTTYAHELMKRLRTAQKIVKELSEGLTPVQLDVVVTKDMLTRPERAAFSSAVDYLRARAKYQSAVLIKREQDKQARELLKNGLVLDEL